MKSKNKLIKILFITSLTFPTLSGISVSANSSEKFRQEFKNKKIIEKNIIDDQIKSKNIHTISKEYKFISLKTLKIETDRLVIAPTVEQDIEKLSEYLMENEVAKYLDLDVEHSFQTKEQAMNFLKNKSSDEIIDAVEFTIKLKDSGLPIGKLDLMLFENSILSLGYWLGKDFQGKGYMSEACHKVVNKAFNASDIEMLYIACDFKNAPSIKLADRIFDHIEKSNKNANLLRKKKDFEGSYVKNGKESSYHYVELILKKIKNKDKISSVLNLQGTKNTRDLGGYAAENQKITKENVFFRSDNTNNLSESDIRQLKEKHNLKYVLDLRYNSEIKMAPDKLNGIEGITYYNFPLCIPKDQVKKLIKGNIDLGDAFIKALDQKDAIKRIFEIFADIDDGSLLFHCTYGKDRTGIVSALLLGLCGVSDEDIVKNYSLTYELIKDSESVKKGIEKYGTDVIFKSSPEYMSKFLTYINQKYGSVKNYLIECGISQENINKILDKFTLPKSLEND